MSGQAGLKVLMIAYGCSPYRSSEPGIGWSFVSNIARRCTLTVLTREKNRKDIESFIAKNPDLPVARVHWVYYDLPRPWLGLKRKLFGVQVYFKLWQWGALWKYRDSFNAENFDIVNHVTLGVAWNPSPFHEIRGKFVWGPVGGGDTIPWSFLVREAPRSILKETFYKALVMHSRFFSGSSRRCREGSSAVVPRTRQVMCGMPDLPGSVLVQQIYETGFDPAAIERVNITFDGIRAVAASRFDYWKGILYAIKGFEAFLNAGGKGTLQVIGDGPEWKRVARYVEKMNLQGTVTLTGKVGLQEFRGMLGKANVVIYPSFRDGGSFVVLESMAMGLPVIVNDLSGPYEMVGEEAGLVAKAESPDGMIAEIAAHLTRLTEDAGLGPRKSEAAARRARELFTWDKHADDLFAVYQEVAGAGSGESTTEAS